MTAKSKNPYPFKVGDSACVRDIRSGRIVDNGLIDRVFPDRVVFKTTLQTEPTPGFANGEFWSYKRKGKHWVERKKDHFHLVVLS